MSPTSENMAEVSLSHSYPELFRVTGPLLVTCDCNCAVTVSSTGAKNRFKEMTTAMSGVLARFPLLLCRRSGLCVCWLFIFKVTKPSSIPYRTHPACAKRAAYPDPPPVIPVPDTGVAEVTHLPSPRSLGEPRPNQLSSEPGSASGPKCFQVLGLSPSLL